MNSIKEITFRDILSTESIELTLLMKIILMELFDREEKVVLSSEVFNMWESVTRLK